jgi:hypothetical protein
MDRDKHESKSTNDDRAAYHDQESCVTTLFPGMLTTILPLEAIHKDQKPIERQNLYIYTTVQDEAETDPNLDACAHLYHTDRER